MSEEEKKEIELEVLRLFSEHQEKHLDYLNNQLTHLKWTAGILATIVFGAFTYLFGQSYSAFEDKMEALASEIEVSYKIDTKVQDKVDDYIEASVAQSSAIIYSRIESNIPALVDTIEPEIQNKVNEFFNEYEGEALREAISERITLLENSNTEEILIPSGTIVAWTKPSIPEGWVICDGNNGTPNLRGRFIYGVANPETLLDIGGSSTHTHNINLPVQAVQDRPYNKSGIQGISTEKNEDSDILVFQTGTASNLPPYVKLFYIMKI